MEITYVTEDPTEEYQKAIRTAKDRNELLKRVKKYAVVADDAIEKVLDMTQDDFVQFKKDLPKLKKATGELAEELVTRWGDIVMPRKMMMVTLVAMEFKVPWGLAYIRCKEDKWRILKQ